MPERVVVTSLVSSTDDHSVVRAVEDVCGQLRRDSGIEVDHLGAERLGASVGRHSWLARDQSLVIHAVDDAEADLRYIEILSDRDDLVDHVAEALQRLLPTESLDDTLAQVDERVVDARTINRLGLLGGELADARVLDVLELAMLSDEPDVRRAAANAAGLLAWPELAEPLAAMAASEVDPAVREMARRAALLCGPAG